MKGKDLNAREQRAGFVVAGIMLAAFIVVASVSAGGSSFDGDCDSISEAAVQLSEDQDAVPLLVKVRAPSAVLDNRDTYERPTGTGDALILMCRGVGVWSTVSNSPVVVKVTEDSDGDQFIFYDATEF